MTPSNRYELMRIVADVLQPADDALRIVADALPIAWRSPSCG